MRNSLAGLFLIGLCLGMSSCAGEKTKQIRNSEILHLEAPELQTVQFKSGRPSIGEGLTQSLALPDIAFEQMRENAQLIKHVNWGTFEVVGSTDDVECVGTECEQLSRRRATAVVDWLIGHGIDKSRLLAKGRGPYLGLTGPYTEGERRISRRVDIDMVVTDTSND